MPVEESVVWVDELSGGSEGSDGDADSIGLLAQLLTARGELTESEPADSERGSDEDADDDDGNHSHEPRGQGTLGLGELELSAGDGGEGARAAELRRSLGMLARARPPRPPSATATLGERAHSTGERAEHCV